MAGFELIKTQNGGPTTGDIYSYNVAAAHTTDIAVGDAVTLTGASTDGKPEVDQAVAGVAFTGIVAGVDFILAGEDLSKTYLPALTAGTVKVQVHQGALYRVDVENGPLADGAPGLNANLVANDPAINGVVASSAMTLNATGAAVTQTLQFRIVELEEDDGGTLGNVAIVRPNNTSYSDGSAGV